MESTFFRQTTRQRQRDNYTNYGLKSNISPFQNPALTSSENDVYDMVINIESRNVRNDFQDKFKEDINETRSFVNLFVFADKSTILHEMSDTDYTGFLGNITSIYRKCENGVKYKIDKETRKIAESLDLSKKIEGYASRHTFITNKDHKPNFREKTKCWLINPARNELGPVSKKHLEKKYRKCCKHHQSQPMAKHFHYHRLV